MGKMVLVGVTNVDRIEWSFFSMFHRAILKFLGSLIYSILCACLHDITDVERITFIPNGLGVTLC